MLLGDLDAAVIKVERPDASDDSRHWPTFAHSHDGLSAYFASGQPQQAQPGLGLR
jgi:crotonobetainyl-CoA:carnitine CoA-transferase CaiB-like acyl-CoA transferase